MTRRLRSWTLLLLAAALAACSVAPPPTLPQALPRGDEVVVLVPGITGSKLRDPGTGRVLWGNGRSIFFPRDRGHRLLLPVAAGAEGGGELEAFDLIRQVSVLGLIRKQAYGPIVRMMAANGYRPSNLAAPDPTAGFFVFPYDWRRDNLTTAAELAARLGELRRLRGQRTLGVVLVCQSNGAHVCRWLAKYGAATLEQAEAGCAAPPPGIEVRKVILVGTANGGSLRILRFLDRGRIYVPGIGRRWAPETIFTWPSVYEDLPTYRHDLFLDAWGRPLAVDLFDPANWRRYGWSVWGEEVQRLAREGALPAGLGSEADREAFLARVLDRARRFHRLLDADAPGFGSPRYYLIQSPTSETPERAVLAEEGGRWRTYFAGDRRIEENSYLRERAAAPGDGHATVASQGDLSPQERAALAAKPLYVDGGHFELILEPAAERRLLEYLVD